MRLSWFSGPPGRRKRAARRRNARPPLRVRQLERRRVLDAAVQSLVVSPPVVAESQEVSTSVTNKEALVFDWTATEAGSGADAGQSADTSAVEISPAANSQGSFGPAIAVAANVPPVLIVAVDQMVNEGTPLDLSGIGAPPLGLYVDPDLADTHTATVNWGDGSATEPTTVFPGFGSGVLGGTHTYTDNGMFEVTVTVTASNGDSDTEKFNVTVNNVAPTGSLGNDGPVFEGDSATVTFSGQFDPSTADTSAGFRFAYDLDNDGTFDVGDGTYAGSVMSESQAVPASFFAEGPGSHTVTARIIDKNGDFTDHTTTIDVLNAAPDLINITGDTVNEDDVATIGVTISDPSVSDVFTVDVNWLDGSMATIMGLGAANANGTVGDTSYAWIAATRRLELSHQYLDDGPGPMDGNPTFTYSVEIVARDDDMDSSGVETADAVVNNVDPVLVVAIDQTVDEGTELDLSGIGAPALGLFVDDGVLDTHTATVDWGDGVIENTVVFEFMGSGVLGGTHTYADNGMYTVTVTVTDDDGGVSDPKSFKVMVNNVPPKVELSGNPNVDEGSSYTLTVGPVTDPGADTVSQYIVHWGDGDTDSISASDLASMGGMVTHTYADGLTAPTIIVDLVDEDGTYLAVDTLSITVDNVAPTLTLSGAPNVNEGSVYTLDLASFDPGDDTITQWTINWGDGVQVVMGNPTSVTHTYADGDDNFTITATATDEDGTFAAGNSVMVMVDNVAPTLTLSGASDTNEGSLYTLNLSSFDPGTDTITQWTINWGDRIEIIAGNPTSVTHIFADGDANYTITATATDEDGTFPSSTVDVSVHNVAPSLTGNLGGLHVNEGLPFVLSNLGASTFNLGLGITDPGFDNPLNPGGATQETFIGVTIDWGDGTTSDALMIVNRASDVVDGPTTALLQHKPHVYADNGDYVVTIMAADDDGGQLVPQQITIHVDNVAPTLNLTGDSFTVNEGQVMNIPNLGAFTDPGFTDAANTPPSVETFNYWISWGDGSVQSGQLPATVINGMRPDMLTPELTIATMGTLANSHLYADNPTGGNQFTITVRLADDDMSGDFTGGENGLDFVEKQIVVTVLNVNPTLDPIAATDVESTGRTVLNLSFADPGADSFQVLVDWGDQPALPPDQRFVVETVHAGATPASFTIEHFYTGPPDPLNPSADIIITVKIFDDDALFAGVIEPGISNLESVAIGNPGIDTVNVAIDTTADVPKLEFLAVQPPQVLLDGQNSSIQSLTTQDIRVASGDAAITSERYLELVSYSPEGDEIARHRLKDEAILDLRGLFATLPDGRYQIVLVRTDNNSRRLVIEVYVRRGRVIDPSDDSEGTRDRPPTSESIEQIETVPLDENPLLEPMSNDSEAMGEQQAAGEGALPIDNEGLSPQPPAPRYGSLRWAAPLAGLALAAGHGGWSQRLDAALQQADDRAWQRLRRAGRLGCDTRKRRTGDALRVEKDRVQ